jgi:transposase
VDEQRQSVIVQQRKEGEQMLYIGIDIAKSKHDCFIINADGEVLEDVFTIQNSKEGFEKLAQAIKKHQPHPSPKNTKVGLEATGHYGNNIVGHLRKIGLPPVILNPLQVSLYRKGQSLRKTKTDKSDTRFIARMMATEGFEPYPLSSYHSEELKCLTRNRHRLVKICSMFKVSCDRLLAIVFPELEKFVSNTLGVTEMNVLLELPGAKEIAGCHTTHLVNIVYRHSRGRHNKDWAVRLKDLAKISIGTGSPARSIELQQVIRQIISISKEIGLVDGEIKKLLDDAGTALMTIPGISYTLAAVIVAEIGDVNRFETPEKLQAFAGLDPTTCQSGQFTGKRNTMVKRGSTYLRWALLIAARTTSRYDGAFREYLDRKLAEGKHYNVAMGHVAKKLIRVIYKLMKTGETYQVKA